MTTDVCPHCGAEQINLDSEFAEYEPEFECGTYLATAQIESDEVLLTLVRGRMCLEKTKENEVK